MEAFREIFLRRRAEGLTSEWVVSSASLSSPPPPRPKKREKNKQNKQPKQRQTNTSKKKRTSFLAPCYSHDTFSWGDFQPAPAPLPLLLSWPLVSVVVLAPTKATKMCSGPRLEPCSSASAPFVGSCQSCCACTRESHKCVLRPVLSPRRTKSVQRETRCGEALMPLLPFSIGCWRSRLWHILENWLQQSTRVLSVLRQPWRHAESADLGSRQCKREPALSCTRSCVRSWPVSNTQWCQQTRNLEDKQQTPPPPQKKKPSA